MVDSPDTPPTKKTTARKKTAVAKPKSPPKASGKVASSSPAPVNVATTDEQASKTDKAKETVKKEASKLKGKAQDKAREVASKGQAKTKEMAGHASKVVGETAEALDKNFGEQYGNYARDAAKKIDELGGSFADTDIDEIVENTKAFIRKRPAIAIGAAAAIGFAFIRLFKADDGSGNA